MRHIFSALKAHTASSTVALLGTAFLLALPTARAATYTWTGATDSTFATNTNWSPATTPISTDFALFNGAGNSHTTIDLGTGTPLSKITFAAGAAAYTIGSGGAGAQTLNVPNNSSAGVIGVYMNSGVTNNQLVNANVTFATRQSGAATFSNDSTTNSLTIAGGLNLIASGGNGTKTVSLTGAGHGTISGAISLPGPTTNITKSGAGTWTLSNSNTYTGTTVISAGTLLITNTTGSGTGTSVVSSSAGTLGGSGSVSGAVTIGNGAQTSGANDSFITGGTTTTVGTFTTASTLSLSSDAVFSFQLDSATSTADKLVATGVTLDASSQFSFTQLGNVALAENTVFTIIDNLGVGAMGTFSNLADNALFTSGLNTYRVSYSGGTGNDLTLTVVPEPQTWLLLSVGLLAVGVCKGRRHRA